MAYKPKNKRLPRPDAQKIIPLEQVQPLNPPPPTPSPSVDASGSLEPSEVLDTVVETHAPKPGGLKNKLAEKIRDIVSGDNDEPAEETKSKYSSYNSKKKQKEEVANLILTIFVIGAAAWQVPEEVKPTRDEMSVVSDHLTSILARHNLLLGKLSGDVLDLVGIIAVGATWYSRVAPELRRLRGPGDGGGGRNIQPQTPRNPPPVEAPVPLDPITHADAATGEWLAGVLNRPGGEE